MAPLRFFVDSFVGEGAQRLDRLPVDPDRCRRDFCTGRLIHERHELVRESRHGAADADAADVRASPDAGHPPALRDVAIHHRAPTPELHDALWGSVNFREIALLVIARAIATI